MKNITVVLFAPKEDENIRECLESARLLTDNIIQVFPDSSFVETVREAGIKQAKTDWVLILDADERLTEELADEIKKTDDAAEYYKIPRKNIFGSEKWLKHGGWWPDYQTRLINKKFFVAWPMRIHSTPIIKGQPEYLKNPIIHFFHGDLGKMVEKTIVFEDIESDLLFKAGKQANTSTFFRKYFAELARRMFKNLGFLDGTIGVIESIYQAFSKTITYLFLYEKNSKSRTL